MKEVKLSDWEEHTDGGFLLKNAVSYSNFVYLCKLKNKPFVVVWIVPMQPQLSKTAMKGKMSKKLEVAL